MVMPRCLQLFALSRQVQNNEHNMTDHNLQELVKKVQKVI